MLRARTLQIATLLAVCSPITVVLMGCTSFESIEQRQVRTDRARMRRGEPLRHHKDTIELSEHAMALRLDKKGGKDVGASGPKNGSDYEFRPNPNAQGGHIASQPATGQAPAGGYTYQPGGQVQYGKIPQSNPARYGAVPGYDDAPPGGGDARGYVTPAGGTAAGRSSPGNPFDEPLQE